MNITLPELDAFCSSPDSPRITPLSLLHQRSRRHSNRIADLFRASGFSKLWLHHLTFAFVWPVTVSGLMRMDGPVSDFYTRGNRAVNGLRAIDISCQS
jgi:hypothetical protein